MVSFREMCVTPLSKAQRENLSNERVSRRERIISLILEAGPDEQILVSQMCLYLTKAFGSSPRIWYDNFYKMTRPDGTFKSDKLVGYRRVLGENGSTRIIHDS